jgi:dTDP-4-amino-4,6-dideoxygalactose transaminase
MGPEVEALERELAEMLEVAETISVSSGTDAILLALMALGIGPGDEVITPTFSFFATAGCVSRLGATPVFVDIDPVTFNIDPTAAAAAVTPRTKAIIPVHLYGLVADMDALTALSAKTGVPLIEDAAQAIGAKRNGKQAGSMGVAGCLSFFPSKNLGAFGDGGLVTTNDATLAKEMRLLRNHGAEPKYFHSRIGGNFRLDALQAAVLRVKAPHLAGWTAARRRNADRYRALFAATGLDQTLTLPVEPANSFHIYNQFVIRGPKRDALRAALASKQIGTEIYYPVPFHRQECFASLGADVNAFPHADAAANTSLALPIYGELTEAQQGEVVDAIAAFYGSGQ